MIPQERKTLPVERAHLAGIARLETLCFGEPWSENALELLLTEMALGVTLVSEDGEVLAYGGMLLAPDEGQITNIAVHPDCRRKGYGRAVTEALIREAEQRGLSQISLEVRASNEAAINLYRLLGFEVAGVRKRFYRNPSEDALVMIKTVS